MTDKPKKKHLDTSAARRIAVAADCDPATVKAVLRGEARKRPHPSRDRARAALIDAGYDVGGDDE